MISHLRPIFALLLRAVREDVRAKFPALLRASVLLVLLLIIVLNQQFRDPTAALGLALLENLVAVNLIAITLLGLATFGSAITEEKEDGTLELLCMTRLNPAAILLGKCGARLLGGLLFLISQIPFVVLCITLGGVALGQIARVYSILGAYLFFLCALGLFFSVICRRTRTAIIASVLVCVGLYFVMLLELAFVEFDPLAKLDDALKQSSSATGWKLDDCLPFFFVLSSACFGLAWACFNPFSGTTQRAAASRKPRGARRPVGSPILWKEYQFSVGGARGFALRFAIYLTLISSVTALVTLRDGRELESTFFDLMAFFGAIGFTLELALAAAAMFGQERREQTLETLLILPTSAARLLWQKCAGQALGLMPALIFLVVSNAAQSASAPSIARFLDLAEFEWLHLAGFYLLLAALTAYLSLRLRRGALLGGFVFIVVWIFFNRMLISGSAFDWDTASMVHFILGPCALVLTATFLCFAIPRRLERCASES